MKKSDSTNFGKNVRGGDNKEPTYQKPSYNPPPQKPKEKK